MDFIVIGAAKSGTTSLWEHLRAHPQVWMPESKEQPLFSSEQRYARGLPWFERSILADASPSCRVGKATPQYMAGDRDCPAQVISARIASALPEIKLIALLRDPIERALSQYRHVYRRGGINRPFDEVAMSLLEERALHRARAGVSRERRYLVNGEYGRLLASYAAGFDREQMLVAFTDEMTLDPEGLLRRAFEFIGVDPGFIPGGLDARHHRGGDEQRVTVKEVSALRNRVRDRARGSGGPSELEAWIRDSWSGAGRLAEPALTELAERVESDVWARPAQERGSGLAAFGFWLENIWNVIPGEAQSEIPRDVRAALEAHYRPDIEMLENLFGVEVPWAWARRPAGGR